MNDDRHILPPMDEDDSEGAQRVFEEFLKLYQPTFAHIEHRLEHMIDEMEPVYADAYRPWHQALQNLFRGVYLIAKKIPLPDPENLMDALRIFSFESAIIFLNDLCISSRLLLPQDWAQNFRRHIDTLLFALSILNRRQQPSLAR